MNHYCMYKLHIYDRFLFYIYINKSRLHDTCAGTLKQILPVLEGYSSISPSLVALNAYFPFVALLILFAVSSMCSVKLHPALNPSWLDISIPS